MFRTANDASVLARSSPRVTPRPDAPPGSWHPAASATLRSAPRPTRSCGRSGSPRRRPTGHLGIVVGVVGGSSEQRRWCRPELVASVSMPNGARFCQWKQDAAGRRAGRRELPLPGRRRPRHEELGRHRAVIGPQRDHGRGGHRRPAVPSSLARPSGMPAERGGPRRIQRTAACRNVGRSARRAPRRPPPLRRRRRRARRSARCTARGRG